MPTAVWNGHLHFGLVVMPVRLLVAARTKTTRFRRLYRKPVNEGPSVTSFPSFSHDREDHESDLPRESERRDPRPKKRMVDIWRDSSIPRFAKSSSLM